uniref:TauD/TfdA-like domain-containing protein n=1 Tax=Spongospora subterranea TaxID=70186 RepID=A0A0H5QZL8_9EUKA|eukprot:CRZ07418.1 hypothetical protein [Spongospora subterranea]
MAITGGMAYIVLFAVFQSIWLVTNCQEKTSPTGIVRIITGADAGLRDFTEEKITLIPMEKPTNMELINILNLPNKFGVSRMTEQLKTMIDPLISLPHKQFRNEFANIIQKVLYEEISEEHSNWIVIPLGISKLSTDEKNVAPAHMDLLRDADVAALLQKYDDSWTIDIMEFLAKNNHVQTSALKHYNGNVEKYAMEMLTLDHLMNIWTPIEPVKAWPLAFTPDTQCDKTSAEEGQHQYLSRFESAPNDWYTRWNMQTNELYVWDSRTVAHAAVDIGRGRGKRSYLATRLLIMHPKYDLSPSVSSPTKDSPLCYTDRLFQQVTRHSGCEATATKRLAEMGYGRRCHDPPTALSPSPSNVKSHVKHGIFCQIRKLLGVRRC